LYLRFNFFAERIVNAWNICPKASILARCPDSNERLNGFDLAISDLRF